MNFFNKIKKQIKLIILNSILIRLEQVIELRPIRTGTTDQIFQLNLSRKEKVNFRITKIANGSKQLQIRFKKGVDEEYAKKLQSPQYRHVMKEVEGKKKYYYLLQPGSSFISKINTTPGSNCVTLTMKTGSTYTGEVNSRNERHGYGVYQVIYGGSYSGQWKNGFKHGNGIFYYKGGNIHYEGEWQCGEPHGKGKVYNEQGKLTFEGQFKNGKSSKNIHWLDYKNY